MSRPKSKSSLVEGIRELVSTLRNMETQLNFLVKYEKKNRNKRGRPPGSFKNPTKKRPKGSGPGPGRPPGSKNKIK